MEEEELELAITKVPTLFGSRHNLVTVEALRNTMFSVMMYVGSNNDEDKIALRPESPPNYDVLTKSCPMNCYQTSMKMMCLTKFW